MSPAMLTSDTPMRSCGSGVQLRGGRGNGKRDATAPAATAATSANHASNGASTAFPQPACQPMPVHVLVHLLEHLSSHRPPAKDSRAILHALHDYIGDAISQPGVSPSSQCSTDFDAIPPSTSPLPWAVPPQPIHTATPTHDVPVSGVPANGAAASAPAKPSAAAFAATRAAEAATNNAVPMAAQPPMAASSTLQEHIMRWSADLGILQAMYSAGFSEGEVEAFVTKLLPGLAEGVKSQLSQAGAQLGGLAGASASAPSAPAASAADLELPLPPYTGGVKVKFSGGAPPMVSDRSASKDGNDDGDASPVETAAGSGEASPPAPVTVPPLPQGGAVVTDRVSPFIQRPYHLLQQLHEHAKTRSGGASGSISGVSSGSASGRAASDIESASSFSKPCPIPLKNGGTLNSPPDSPAASKPASTTASPTSTPQDPTDASDDSGNIFTAVRKSASNGDESPARESPAQPSPASVVSAKGSPSAPASSAEAGAAAVAQPHASAGWQSVLDMLISAGPQTVQPAAAYVPSYAWGSGNSSTEPDTFSAKSEDPTHGGGDGAAPAPAATASASTSKAKKRRNKRSKNGSRNGA